VKRELITEIVVRQAIQQGKPIVISENAIITPAAQDLIRENRLVIQRAGLLNGSKTDVPQQPKFEKRWGEALFSNKKVIALGADHGGYPVKEMLKDYIVSLGFEIADYGTDSVERTDYPIYAAAVARAVQKGDAFRGIIIDGAGIGSAITANKFNGIRAATVWDTLSAKNCRAHNDANILSLGGLLLGVNPIKEIVRIFLTEEYEGGRHQERLDLIAKFEVELFKE
jgi:ribose 5-phosphate isomerase B